MKVLHIGRIDTFAYSLMNFLEENLTTDGHSFFLLYDSSPEGMVQQSLPKKMPLIDGRNWDWPIKLLKAAQSTDKIILHGLFDFRIIVFLFFNFWLLKKAYWIIWGSDLYRYNIFKKTWKWKVKEYFRRPVIKNIAYLVTATSGDVDFARKWYTAKGKHINSLCYPSNIYIPLPERSRNPEEPMYILAGNSASPANNHEQIFEKLRPYRDQNIEIIVPLSYGDPIYAERIIELGYETFKEKFKPITAFMPLPDYLQLLSKIQIAIFAHLYQQGTGNAVSLLTYGTTVYLRKESTLWNYFGEQGIRVFDFDSFELKLMSSYESEINQNVSKSVFSKENLIRGLSSWLTK